MLCILGGFMILYELICKKTAVNSVTIWTLCYVVVFVGTPWLTGHENIQITSISTFSFIVYLSTVILCDTLRSVSRRGNTQIKQLQFLKTTIKNEKIDDYASVFLAMCLACLILFLLSSELHFTSFMTYASSSMLEQSSLAKVLFSFFSRCVTAFCVYSFLSNGGRFTIQNCINLIIVLVVLFIFGFTRMTVISTLIMFSVSYMKDKKAYEQIVVAIICVLVLVGLMSVMMYVRVFGIRDGIGELFKQGMNTDIIKRRLANDLDFSHLYVAFEEELSRSPGMMVTPLCYLKPLFVLIPRSIWPGKPESLNVEIYKYLNPNVQGIYSTGYTILGEAYAVLGYLGFFIYPVVWGIVCSMADNYFKRIVDQKRCNELGCLVFLFFSVEMSIEGMRGNIQQAIMNMMFPMVMVYIVTRKVNIMIGRKRVL